MKHKIFIVLSLALAFGEFSAEAADRPSSGTVQYEGRTYSISHYSGDYVHLHAEETVWGKLTRGTYSTPMVHVSRVGLATEYEMEQKEGGKSKKPEISRFREEPVARQVVHYAPGTEERYYPTGSVAARGYGIVTPLHVGYGTLDSYQINRLIYDVTQFQKAAARDTKAGKLLTYEYLNKKGETITEVVELPNEGNAALRARLEKLAEKGRSLKNTQILYSVNTPGKLPNGYRHARWFPAAGAAGAVVGLERLFSNGGAYAQTTKADCSASSAAVNCGGESVAKRLLSAMPAGDEDEQDVAPNVAAKAN